MLSISRLNIECRALIYFFLFFINNKSCCFFVDEQITTSLLGYNDAIQTAVCAAQYDLAVALEPIITVVCLCLLHKFQRVDKGKA